MIKKIIFSVLFVAIAFGVKAQSMYGDAVKADVKMNYVYSLEEAITKAKKENKLIFFNCFADWAMPCHSMNMVVFSDQAFCDYMNKTFVNLFVDVSKKGVGTDLAKKYGIKTFAHYLVLNSDGEIVHVISGGKKLPEFKDCVARSLSPKTSYVGTKKKYESGKYSKEDLKNYLIALNLADEREKLDELIDDYVNSLSKKDYLKKDNWDLITQKAKDIKSPVFKNILEYRTLLEKSVGKENVDSFISNVYGLEVADFATGNTEYDSQKLLDLYLEMTKNNVPEDSFSFVLYKMAKYRGEKNYKALIDLFETETEKLGPHKYSLLGSLKTCDFSDADKKMVSDYILKLSEGEQGNTQKYLKNLSNEILYDGKQPEELKGIEFYHGDFNSALKLAGEQNKLVFLDCYTTWCGPCKMLAKNVFTQDAVGKYFNAKFINIKIDMEKGEGKDLAERYKIKAFPTMLILDKDGNELHRIVGFRVADVLIEEAKKAVEK